MVRVLKITSGLLGVALLALVCLLGMGRRSDSPPNVLLVHAGPGIQLGAGLHPNVPPAPPYELWWLIPESNVRHRIGGEFRTVEWLGDLWKDGWVYFLGAKSIERNKLYRMRLDGSGLTALTDALDAVQPLPNRQWLIAGIALGVMKDALYRIANDGAVLAQLSPPNFVPKSWDEVGFESNPPGINREGVFFAATPIITPQIAGKSDVFWADWQGATITNFTQRQADSFTFDRAPTGASWLTVRNESDGRLYLVPREGGDWQRVTQDDSAMRNVGWEWSVLWLEQAQILIVAESPFQARPPVRYSAYRISSPDESPQQVWNLPISFHDLSPDGQWLLIIWRDGLDSVLGKVRLATGERSEIVRIPNTDLLQMYGYGSVAGWSPDSQWIYYYQQVESNPEPYNLWRVNSESQLQQQVVDNVFTLGAPTFSPDGKWITFVDFMNPSSVTSHILRLDGGMPYPIMPDFRDVMVLGWIGMQDKKWQPPFLATGGIALMASFYVIGRVSRNGWPK